MPSSVPRQLSPLSLHAALPISASVSTNASLFMNSTVNLNTSVTGILSQLRSFVHLRSRNRHPILAISPPSVVHRGGSIIMPFGASVRVMTDHDRMNIFDHLIRDHPFPDGIPTIPFTEKLDLTLMPQPFPRLILIGGFPPGKSRSIPHQIQSIQSFLDIPQLNGRLCKI